MDRLPFTSGFTMVSKKEMHPSSLLSSTKFYGRVNTVYVLEEALFIGLLVDNKGVIHIPVPEPGGWGAVLRVFALRTPYRGLLLWDLLGNPWPHPQPVQRTDLGRRNRYFSDKIPIGE